MWSRIDRSLTLESLSGQLFEQVVETVEHRSGGGQLLLAELRERVAPERLEHRAAGVHESLTVLGERGEHHALIALGAGALHEPGGLEPVEHLGDAGRRQIGRQRQLARRHLALASQAEQQPVLRMAQFARPVRLAPAQPPHRCRHGPERLGELVEHVGAIPDGGHAATASAIVSASACAAAPFARRAARSARTRITQGMIASALSPAETRNAVPYASAAAFSVCAPTSARCRTTASTAVPIEPPTRCSTLSCGVACGSSERSSEANAAAIAGMKAKPIPMPRTNIASDSQSIGVRAPISPKGIDAIVVTITPKSARGPPPRRSLSRPARGITSAIPTPCGAVSRPVSRTVSWRTPCQY